MDSPTLHINGEDYPFLSGRGAMRLYCRKKGITDVGGQDLIEALMKMSPDDADLMNYFALKTGGSKAGKKFPFTFEEFQDLLDEQPHLADEMEQIAEEQAPTSNQMVDDNLVGNAKPVKAKN